MRWIIDNRGGMVQAACGDAQQAERNHVAEQTAAHPGILGRLHPAPKGLMLLIDTVKIGKFCGKA